MSQKQDDIATTLPQEKRFRLVTSEMEVKSASGMRMSGYVSTSDPDLANDIIQPKAFEKHLHRYKANPVYCYNHDAFMPIGKVGNVSIDSKGLYLDDITLSDVPIVRDYLWKLIEDGVLKQQSIGFYSLAGDWTKNNLYEHKEVYLLESSLVTVACNPEAYIDSIKSIRGFEQFGSMDALLTAYKHGVLPDIETVKKDFYFQDVPELSDDKSDETAMRIDIKTLSSLNIEDRVDAIRYVTALPAYHEDFQDVKAATHLVSDSGVYRFQVALYNPETKGVVLDWDMVATSMTQLMGARDGDRGLSELDRKFLIRELAEAYKRLGKEVPRYGELPVDLLHSSRLCDIKFVDVEFLSGEKALLELKTAQKNLRELSNYIKSLVKSGAPVSPELREEVKGVWYAFVSVEGFLTSAADAAKAQALLDLLFDEAEEPEDAEDSTEEATSIYEASADVSDEVTKNGERTAIPTHDVEDLETPPHEPEPEPEPEPNPNHAEIAKLFGELKLVME